MRESRIEDRKRSSQWDKSGIDLGKERGCVTDESVGCR